ncbi:hypothetical protein LCGC14_2078980 [marine sediment metagenome]|uniref:Uncharacterized protein n=1 Tax=marine sediment metagenome TaxID=412755 RepID=A0A0F9HD27_9ZZZZ
MREPLGTLTADQIIARGGRFLRVWGRRICRLALVQSPAGDLVDLVECRCVRGGGRSLAPVRPRSRPVPGALHRSSRPLILPIGEPCLNRTPARS